jgi:integrase
MNDLTKREQGGYYTYSDLTAAHPHVAEAMASIEGIAVTTGQAAREHHMTMARRTAWFIAQHYPGVHPNDLGHEFFLAERAWVKSQRFSMTLTGRKGGRLLFTQLVSLGHRDPALPNPFDHHQAQVKVLPPAVLPAQLVKDREALLARLNEQAEARVNSEGREGHGSERARDVMVAFDGLLNYVVERNASADAEDQCALDTMTLFGRPEIIAAFLKAGKSYKNTADGEASHPTRRNRASCLMAAYTFFEFKGRAPAGFREALDRELRQGGFRKELGGRSEREIDALDPADVARVRALLSQRLESTRSLLDVAPPAKKHWARIEYIRVARQHGMFETALGTGGREQAVSSMEATKIFRTARGSYGIKDVRWKHGVGPKQRQSTHWKVTWLPARAFRAICLYLEATGRPRPLTKAAAVSDGANPYARPILVKKGQKYAATVLPKDRTVFPIFRKEDGSPVSPINVRNTLKGLLNAARCATDRPHVLRHTACAIAINEWGVSPSEAARVFGWATVRLVLERYSRGPVESLWEKMDGLSERDTLAPMGVRTVVADTGKALSTYLGALSDAAECNALPQMWSALVAGLDQLAAVDPQRPRLSSSFVLTAEELARLDLWILERTDRHLRVGKILGREVAPGLPAPEIPDATPARSDDDRGAA